MRGERIPDVPKLLQPLIERYEASFKEQPRTYETEYLDSLEIAVAILSTASTMMNASRSIPPANEPRGEEQAKQKALAEGAQVFAKVALELRATINRAMATGIRDRVAKGMFTEGGAKRALTIADRLAPQ